MKIKIVTNCTARKAYPPIAALRARSLPRGTIASLAKEWRRRVDAAPDRIVASVLYQGRAFREAIKAARLAETRLLIVSAGMGLIAETDRIPPYSLTASEDHRDALKRRLGTPLSPSEWWTALQLQGVFAKGLSDRIGSARDSIFVLALSPAYLQLIGDDLSALTPSQVDRIRLVGPRRESDAPESLRRVLMPYDDRLDGARSPIRGTESDFPQRATRHFVQAILSKPVSLDAEAHKTLVRRALQGWPRKKIVSRRRLPEKELLKEVAAVLRECDGRWSRALRRLRDQRKIACKQERFRAICKGILETRG